jgi:Zn-dependent M28 family amino/carboxypeptidase
VKLLAAGVAALVLLGLVVVATGDGDDGGPARLEADRFDSAAAWRLLEYQVGLGPRPAGSEQSLRLARRLRRLLPRGRFEPVPGGLRNVVGTVRGREPGYIVVGAHYDTKDIPGFVGANDGAGGTAALIEVARALRSERRPRNAREIRFVLFDGEEEPPGSTDFATDALRGSKAYVKAHRGSVGSMVLLDYIANKGLRLPREGSSDPALWARMRAAAARVGVAAVFPPRVQTSILDDTTPFIDAGIPAIDLIDFSYRYSHTTQDTVDKLSLRSLDAVGESVIELLRELRAS